MSSGENNYECEVTYIGDSKKGKVARVDSRGAGREEVCRKWDSCWVRVVEERLLRDTRGISVSSRTGTCATHCRRATEIDVAII